MFWAALALVCTDNVFDFLLLNQGVTVTNVDIVVGSRGSNSEEDSVI
jgi:hypothetical protein